MIGLAVLLFLGALGAGYWGVSLSSQTQSQAPSELPAKSVGSHPSGEIVGQDSAIPFERSPELVSIIDDRVGVVVLSRDLSAHDEITAEDLAVERMRIAPPGSFTDPETLVGRKVWRSLPAGTVLGASSFEAGGPLARMILPNERALAIQIDEVVGGGGHLGPGDYVDVLLFLREDGKNSDQTMQVVVPALRLLSVGNSLGLDLSGQPVSLPEESDDPARRQPRADNARTAVLAIPDELLTRFALAAQVGSLRLAVRSAAEGHLSHYYDSGSTVTEELNQQLFQFEKFALRHAERPQPGLVVRPRGIEVIRGSEISRNLP